MKFSYSTDRLVLKILDHSYADMVLSFFREGRDSFRPYEPDQPKSFYTLDYQCQLLDAEYKLALHGSSVRFWLFEKDHPEKAIGTISFSQIRALPFSCCELGYKILPAFWRQGYASEAISQGLVIMFQEFNLHRIQAKISPRNIPSIHLLEKLQFQPEGICRECVYIHDHWQDHFVYSMTSSDFYNQSNRPQ